MKNQLALIASIVTLSVTVPAFAWAPFTPVVNVCETCEQAPADVVMLNNGTTLRGDVVGENPSFWVVVRYTEARAIPKSDVKSITWKNNTKPAIVSNSDQLLLKNGVVLNGSIIEDKSKPPVIQLKSSYLDQTYIVFKAEVAEAYKAGARVDLGT